MELADLERRLGVSFRDRSLLEMALTHRSAINEGIATSADNERLEFLGDAVLGAAVADLLYLAFPEFSEGTLTNMRAELVRGVGLAVWARTLDIAPYIVLGHGEEGRGGRGRDGLLASAFEAIVGAIYRDQGYERVRAFIEPFVAEAIPSLSPSARPRDAKSELQYRAQSRWRTLPSYRVLEMEGPEHQPLFTVEVEIEDGLVCTGSGRSRQAAEQAAAQALLDIMDAAETGSAQC